MCTVSLGWRGQPVHCEIMGCMNFRFNEFHLLKLVKLVTSFEQSERSYNFNFWEFLRCPSVASFCTKPPCE